MKTWDMGDPEPEGVESVESTWTRQSDDYDDHPIVFGKCVDGDWKGYVHGGKTYLSWDELTRRFGPLKEYVR